MRRWKLTHYLFGLVIIALGSWMGSVTQAVAAETVTYYYTNPQGTVLATTDAGGNLLTTSDYRPYGAQALGSPAPGPGYTGHVNDPDSGLIYMQARYYDPGVARFISADPKPISSGKPGSFSRYGYASNSPLLNVDPMADSRCQLRCIN